MLVSRREISHTGDKKSGTADEVLPSLLPKGRRDGFFVFLPNNIHRRTTL